MEPNVKVLPPEVLMEQLPALLEEAPAVPLVITGSSMVPFLVHGRDTVYLSKITAPLKRGDMILYRRSNGMYVLHRILRVEAESYTLLGDAQTDPEPGIRTQQILARVSAVRRKGKLLQNGSFWWEFFAKFWLRAVSLRPALLGLYSRLVR
jgi:hypothetical protein